MHQAINRLNASGASIAQQGYGALAALTWLVEEKTGASLGATFLHEKMQHWQKRASGWGTLADLAQTDPITDFLTQLPAAGVSVGPPLVGGMAARGTASQILKRLPGWMMNESARKTAEKYIAGFIEKQGLEKIALFGGGVVGGVQSSASKYNEVYAAHRQKGVPELEARQMALEPALLAGLTTTALTIGGGANGVEAFFRQPGGRELLKRTLWERGKLFGKHFKEEALEEGTDSFISALISMMYYDPDKPLEEIVKEVWHGVTIGGTLGGKMGMFAGESNVSGGRAGTGTARGQVGTSNGLAKPDGLVGMEPKSGNEASQIAEVYDGVLASGEQQGAETVEARPETPHTGSELSSHIPNTARPSEATQVPARSAFRDASGKINVPDWNESNLPQELQPFENELKQLVDNVGEADRRYNALPESKGGKVINTDIAREMLPVYADSREGRIKYTEATGKGAKMYAADRIYREIENRGNRRKLMFTAGGIAAGKSTVVNDAMIARHDLVFDGTMRDSNQAIKTIQQALDKGWDVQINYIQRPIELVIPGAITRAGEIGRWTSIADLPAVHADARLSILKISKHFEGESRVKIDFWRNDGKTKQDKPKLVSRAEIEQDALQLQTTGETNRSTVEAAFRSAVTSGKYSRELLERLAGHDLKLKSILDQELKQ